MRQEGEGGIEDDSNVTVLSGGANSGTSDEGNILGGAGEGLSSLNKCCVC